MDLTNTMDRSYITSRVGDFAGDQVKIEETPTDYIERGTKTGPDTHQLTERWIDLTEQSFGGPINAASTAITVMTPITALAYEPLVSLNRAYLKVSWKSISVRISVYDPKGVAGGMHVGWYPLRDWFDLFNSGNLRPFNSGTPVEVLEATRHNVNEMTAQRLTLAPECQLMTFGESSDYQFDIPWQFPYTHLELLDFWSDQVAMYAFTGIPMIFVHKISHNYCTSVQYATKYRVFIKFNGLKYEGPDARSTLGKFADQPPTDMRKQSGGEAVALAALADVAITAGAEIASSMVGSYETDEPDYGSAGTFDDPSAVQLSYAGDTTAVGPSPLSPVFSKPYFPESKHPIISFLTRPQWIGKFTVASGNGTTELFYADPMSPRGAMNSDSPTCTYFNWFGQCANYWRGTLVFDIVILGHPMVEVEFVCQISYPSSMFIPSNVGPMAETMQLKGTCKGVHRIRVPMPFATTQDWLAINDSHFTSETERSWTVPSALHVFTRIISTMLDVAPTIEASVYMSAMEDFTFAFPRPPGLYDLDNPIGGFVMVSDPKTDVPVKQNPVLNKLGKKAILQPQVGLLPPNDVVETRAKVQEPVKSMPVMTYVEDFFQYWSRALPADTVDSNDEPIVRAVLMIRPSWYWPGESAAWTADVNNSWYCTNDYISLFSSHFMLYHGSIAAKVLCGEDTSVPYKYISLGTLAPRQKTHNPFTAVATAVPSDANFGAGTVITPADKQPVLELTLPYRSVLYWNWSIPSLDCRDSERMETIRTNVNLHEPGGDLKDSLFRKTGPDYALAVEGLLPPPTLWMAKGWNWS